MKLKVTIDGKTYEVKVDEAGEESTPDSVGDETTSPMQSAILPTASKPNSSADINESKICRCPLAGLVLRIYVKPGQQVKANELMMVLDAMKMETNINAPVAGTIKSVEVAPGAAVKASQVLICFE